MLQQLNEGIVYTYNTTQTAVASALRAEVPFIYADEAPPATPYPIIIFENSAGSTEETFCSTLDIVSVDFKTYSNTASEALELAYNIKKLYQNNLFPTDDGYTVLRSRYITTFKTYDTVENKWEVTTEIQYTIESASDYGVTTPYTPDRWNSVYTTVQSNSADWGTGGEMGNYLPLSGGTMTGTIDMSGNEIIDVSHVHFDLTETLVDAEEGRLSWDDDAGTLTLGMPGGEVNLQVGQEMLLPRTANNPNLYDIDNGNLVYILSGGTGVNFDIAWADNENEVTSSQTIAMATEDITSGQKGYCTTSGLVRGLSTDAYSQGEILYLGLSGQFTNIRPAAPLHAVTIGLVFRSHPTEGSVYVKIQNGFELDELHDVLFTNLQDDDTLIYNSSNGLWENSPSLGGTLQAAYDLSTQPQILTNNSLLALQVRDGSGMDNDIFEVLNNDGSSIFKVDTFSNATLSGSMYATDYYGDGSNLTGIETGAASAINVAYDPTFDEITIATDVQNALEAHAAEIDDNKPTIYRNAIAPTPSEDSGSGYKVGDLWVDTTTNIAYQCVSDMAMMAIWDQINAAGGDSPWELVAKDNDSIAAVDRGAGYIAFDSENSLLFGQGAYINVNGTAAGSNIVLGGGPGGVNRINMTGDGSANCVIGGLNNYIEGGNGDYMTVIGGNANRIYGTTSNYSTICGGQNSYINNSTHGFVGGGQQNLILGALDYNAIVGGLTNQINNGRYSAIMGGRSNNIITGQYGFIGGGFENDITGTSNYSAILGGYQNVIPGSSSYATILGGRINECNANYTVAAGYHSEANSAGSFVFSDSNTALTVDGGINSFTMNFAGGLDMVPVTTEPDAPAIGRVTLFMFDDGASTFSLKAKFSDSTVNTITTHTVV